MNHRLRIAILTGCLFVIALHLEQGGRLLREVWRGPYLGSQGGSTGALHAAVHARRAAAADLVKGAAEWDSSTRLASSK